MQRHAQHSPVPDAAIRKAADKRETAANATRQNAASRRSTERRGRRSPVVLVVDDDADVREAVRAVLEDEGYATLEASDGREALELLRRAQQKPDLMLLDLMMPTMDGWQLRARLREDPALAPLPIVIMTAHAGVLRAVTNVRSAPAVLAKPLNFDRLLELVAAHCKGRPTGVH